MGNFVFFSDAAREAKIRFEPDDFAYVNNKGRGRTFNKAMAIFIRLMREIEAEALAELRGYFTNGEWCFMAEALKNQREPIASKNELSRLIMMVQNMETTSSYYGVVPAELCDKIMALQSVHVLAISERVNEFWHRSELVTMREWAEY